MSNQPWDRLYTTRKWRNLRARHLAKNRLCVMCMEKGRPTLATICDHIEPHKGDMLKFWSGPFQSLCKPHHDATKQSLEKGGEGRQPKATIGLDGWPE